MRRFLWFWGIILGFIIVAFIIKKNSRYEYANFYERALKIQIFATIRPDLLNHYISVDNCRVYVNTIVRDHGEAPKYLPHLLCSLFQLGYKDFKKGDLDRLTAVLMKDPYTTAYDSLVSLVLVQNKVDKRLLHRILSNLKTSLAEACRHADRLNTKKQLYRYLITSYFFEVKPDIQLVNTALNFLYPERTVYVGETFNSELAYDLIIAKYTNMHFDKEKLVALFRQAWTHDSYFVLSDCSRFCDLKSIHLAVLMDLLYEVVPREYLSKMLSYLLSRFDTSGALVVRDENDPTIEDLFVGRCDHFCNEHYWQVLVDLNYLVQKSVH